MVIMKVIFQEGVENEDKFNFMTLKLGFYNIPGQNGDLLKFTIIMSNFDMLLFRKGLE